MIVFQNLEQLNLQDNQEYREQVLSNFDWTDETLDIQARKAIEEIFVDFQDIFARHRFYICINTDFKAKLHPLRKGQLIFKVYQHQSTSKKDHSRIILTA